MGWLVGYTLASMVSAFVVVRAFDAAVSGTTENASRGIVFVTTWAGVTAHSGMRNLSKAARQLRRQNMDRLDAMEKERSE